MPALIIADNALTGRGIRWELRTYAPSLDVIGYVDRRSSCAAAVASANPDLVIIDELGTSEAALSFITSIREAAPAAKLLLLTAHMQADWLAKAAAAGIDAAVARTSTQRASPPPVDTPLRVTSSRPSRPAPRRCARPRRRRRSRTASWRSSTSCRRNLERRDRRRALGDRADGQVPPLEHLVVVMRHVDGLSPPEIATRTGHGESSVHGLHHRGRLALQAQLRCMDAVPVTAPARFIRPVAA